MDGSRLPFCRLMIEATPRSGRLNMAIDEALLERAAAGDAPLLRWYRWEEPTISLGYFQDADAPDLPPGLARLPRVRRLSGGGSIVHDQEWTYSLTLPPKTGLVTQPHELYERVHGPIIEELQARGFPVRLRGETRKEIAEPFLCFYRQDENDIVCGEHKVLGSAQRRRRSAILQHGSLVVRASQLYPALPGLLDLAPDGDDRDLAAGLSRRMLDALADGWEPVDPPADLLDEAEGLMKVPVRLRPPRLEE